MLVLSTGLNILSIPKLTLTDEQRGNMQRWVDALESGNYKQGQSSLRTDKDCYCCLGVAADVHPNTTKESWFKQDPDSFYHYITRDDSGGSHLPRHMVSSFGLSNEWGFYIWGTDDPNGDWAELYSLPDLNDSFAVPFKDIAAILKIAMTGGLDPDRVEETSGMKAKKD